LSCGECFIARQGKLVAGARRAAKS
jgi:hypothetical protein